MISKLRDIPHDRLIKFQRAGVVPCKKEHDKIIFAFGVDRRSGLRQGSKSEVGKIIAPKFGNSSVGAGAGIGANSGSHLAGISFGIGANSGSHLAGISFGSGANSGFNSGSNIYGIDRRSNLPFGKSASPRKGSYQKRGDISNFAGTIHEQEDCVKGAMREFMEESHECFGIFNINSLENCIAIYNETEVIIFLCTEWDDRDVNYRFEQKKKINSEMECLFICDDEELLRIVMDQQNEVTMYERVKTLIFDAIKTNGIFF